MMPSGGQPSRCTALRKRSWAWSTNCRERRRHTSTARCNLCILSTVRSPLFDQALLTIHAPEVAVAVDVGSDVVRDSFRLIDHMGTACLDGFEELDAALGGFPQHGPLTQRGPHRAMPCL